MPAAAGKTDNKINPNTGSDLPGQAGSSKKSIIMNKYVCNVCGYVYDPEKGDPDSGIAPGTPFEAIPDTWVCPLCGVDKSNFEELN